MHRYSPSFCKPHPQLLKHCILEGVSELVQFLDQHLDVMHSAQNPTIPSLTTSRYWLNFSTRLLHTYSNNTPYIPYFSLYNLSQSTQSATPHYKVDSSKASFCPFPPRCTQTPRAQLRTQAQQTTADSLSQHRQVSSLFTGGSIFI